MENSDSITFKTNGVWTADELSRFVAAVDTIYKALLAVHITRESTPSVEERVSSVEPAAARFIEQGIARVLFINLVNITY